VRILVNSSPWSLPRHVPNVFAELLAHGADVVFAAAGDENPVPPAVEGHGRANRVVLPLRRTNEAEAVALFRRVTDLVRFLDPALPDARWPRRRTALRALVRAGHPDAEALAARIAALELPEPVHARLTETLRGVELLLPPEPGLVEAVGELAVDAVLLVSRCSLGGVERDLLKAARRLGLPTIMLVWSWDNLSSKALLTEQPDQLLVWNDLQVDEAVRLHGMPRERVHALGAPSLDDFFLEVERHAGDTPGSEERATIVYLGSSSNISPAEPTIFERWLNAVRASDDERVRSARVLLRPYPAGTSWKRWQPPEPATFAVERGRKLDAAGLARLLLQADAVVALNTSGELEAAIAGRPVVTFRAGELAPGQEGSVHFEYLLERHGGFVVDSADLDEHVRNLARVLAAGHDRESVQAFVTRFVRPLGLDRPVSPLVASTVLELAAQPRLAVAAR
jgi:hypothetical protein